MNDTASTTAAQKPSFGGRWTYAILIVAVLFVSMPFLFWNATWFGRPLTDDQIAKAFQDRKHAREIQHALTQIEQRMERNDPTVRHWYPQLVNFASDPLTEIRVTDAWVMGQDNKAPEFHEALSKMLTDADPMVARNAALSLVRFGDSSGHSVIVSMLAPYAVPAPEAGTLRQRLKPGETVNPGTMIGHIDSNGESREVRTKVPGTIINWTVADNTAVTEGQPIMLLAPSQELVWEALRALYLIGQPEDIPVIAPYVRGADAMPPQIQQQAKLTMQQIESRQVAPASLPASDDPQKKPTP
jgi:biotin carboxyl carrier protein